METYVKQFLNQARRFPKHPAALDIQGAMTYDRLNRLSACLAERILKELGGEDRRGRIAVHLPRTKAFAIAQLGVG